MAILTLIAGLVILTAGGECLVRHASKLASAIGISPLVIGLTVVAFGTSSPELVVSVQSALAGKPDVALGNVIGSNIFNILFILGISPIIIPLSVSHQLARYDLPILLAVSVGVWLASYDGSISKANGLVLSVGLIIYTIWAVKLGRRQHKTITNTDRPEPDYPIVNSRIKPVIVSIALLALGLALLMVGSKLFVDAAIAIARQFGVSELVIGLTIVAAGTSLPEVATSVLAALRGERDIAVGNVIGSNLFNLLGVLGIAGLVSADGIHVADTAFDFDMPVMILATVICLPIFITQNSISRWEGAIYIIAYVLYTISLFAMATSAITVSDSTFALYFLVSPILAVVLLLSFWRSRMNGANPIYQSNSRINSDTSTS